MKSESDVCAGPLGIDDYRAKCVLPSSAHCVETLRCAAMETMILAQRRERTYVECAAFAAETRRNSTAGFLAWPLARWWW